MDAIHNFRSGGGFFYEDKKNGMTEINKMALVK